ncbi:hypothetical protein Deba_2735 [Desulfarculus baarsii DSM 2075]|uniref:Uncharacterized protein n=1 Tax=Desulfarculus baarsii (strain ATCC 33931 / DSM 2075 / LMG 7858 / VKM B-1802 / 2st14) TaxID=644282 RepID=E1QKJ6_DESB2|nr:hypothetical protein [Desulfarculus baarsii]ADK86089.1 hypothetical protein Deba_2735 [Desulfarculus baarsii DSM 2075]
MFSYDAEIEMLRAWDYPNPEQPGAALPLVYGDMSLGGAGGLWPAVCLDAANLVYAVAGHPMKGPVSLHDADGQAIAPISCGAENYLGKGVICLARLSQQPAGGQVLARGKGKMNADGALLENPLEIAADLLAFAGQDPAQTLDLSAYGRARAAAHGAGLTAAGVIDRPQSLAAILTALMGEFLGSWWLDGRGRLKLLIDIGSGALDESELSCAIGRPALRQVEVSASLADVVNRADALYCLNPASGEYLAAFDGRQTQNQASISLYGRRALSLELNWVRAQATARAISRRLVEVLGVPRRMIDCEEGGLAHIGLEKGDAALFSLPWLHDDQGLPLVNQVTRVLSVEPQMDRRLTRLCLMDTGYFKTLACRADGSRPADGVVKAGGDRDRRAF